MSVVFIRAILLYILVIFSVRLMGKRQLGELQPSELVITILVSNIATLPVEDTDIPILVGITPILTLVSFEVIVSWLSLKMPRLRKVISGSPKIIISGGRIDPKVLRELRFSVDDLMTSLRGQNIFDLSEVQFAIVETTGSLSVMKRQSCETPQRCELGISADEQDPPQVIAADGKLIPEALAFVGMDRAAAGKMLSRGGVKLADVLLMTADSGGKCFIVKKDGGEPVIMEGRNDKSVH